MTLFHIVSPLYPGADLGGGCRGCAPPPEMRWFSNTTGILQKKKTKWFIGVEVEKETSAPPPEKNPGSAPAIGTIDQPFAHVIGYST